jgi:hypothetical protein
MTSADRGPVRALTISAGSNTTVKSGPGRLHRINWTKPDDSTIRIENGQLGATPDLNNPGARTLFFGLAATTDATLDFSPGVGFEDLTIAATSNAKVNVVYE